MTPSRLHRLRQLGIEPWPARTRRNLDLQTLVALETPREVPACGLPVGQAPARVLAGRLLARGETSLTLGDATTTVELSGGQNLRLWAELEVGDWIEVELVGSYGREIADLRLLAPCLEFPPTPGPNTAPFGHITPGGGADLLTLQKRSTLLHTLRTWFLGQGFVEVETPALATSPGLEPYLDPFETRWKEHPGAPGEPRYLLTSPEYAMKRLLVGGLERCFQLSRVFRNGEVGPNHNPEFTLLEWYRALASYDEIAEDLQSLILHMAVSSRVGLTLHRGGHTIDLTPPWEHLTVRDAVQRYAGFDLAATMDQAGLAKAAARAGVFCPDNAPWDEIFFRVLMEKVEPHLGYGKPTFLKDYPAPLAALARVREGEFPVAERFELYIAGVELANAFTELNDPVLQAERFEEERTLRKKMGFPVFEADPAYLAALRAGLPPTGGIAVGIDRLVMVLLGAKDVRSVLAFPWQNTP